MSATPVVERPRGLAGLARRALKGPTSRVMYITLAGMLLGLAADAAIAALLGADIGADAVIAALTLPMFVNTVAVQGTKFSLVPLMVERREKDAEEYRRFVSGIVNLGLTIGLALTLLAMLAARPIVFAVAPGFSEPAADLATSLLRISAWLMLVTPPIAVLSVYLNAERRFQLVAFRNTFVPGMVLAGLGAGYLLADIAAGAVWGHVLGFSLYFVWLFAGAMRAGYRHQVRAWPPVREIWETARSTGLPTIGFFFRQGSRIAERSVASTLGAGGVAMYYFAFRIFAAGQTLIGYSIAMTRMPKLAEEHISGTPARTAAILKRGVRMTLLLSIPATVAVLLLAGPIVDFLYGRGSFSGADVDTTARLFRLLGLSLPWLCLAPVFTSVLYARKDYLAITKNMLSMAALNVAVVVVLAAWLGIDGIAIGSSIATVASVWSMKRMLARRGIRTGIPFL